jgi:hypothetical protein
LTQQFYATVQNKLHWAIHGSTAAELISKRANHQKPFMGLMTWKNSPDGKILKSDTKIAKNYLSTIELDELNHIVVMYLDYAELQAKKQRLMKMEDWTQKLDSFLLFNDYSVLGNSGKVSAALAESLAEKEFESYRLEQDSVYSSDFDKLVEISKDAKKTKTIKEKT